jgi:hypothetical protein
MYLLLPLLEVSEFEEDACVRGEAVEGNVHSMFTKCSLNVD